VYLNSEVYNEFVNLIMNLKIKPPLVSLFSSSVIAKRTGVGRSEPALGRPKPRIPSTPLKSGELQSVITPVANITGIMCGRGVVDERVYIYISSSEHTDRHERKHTTAHCRRQQDRHTRRVCTTNG
jgi:hypothetical protein